jgi:hypothetical protein
MTGDDIARRIRAWHVGHPLPRYSTIHYHVADPVDALVLAFVRMGGESAPWGIAFGHPGRPITVLTVPEARNRDLVAQMAAQMAPVLLEHFRHPNYSSTAPSGPDDSAPLRQLWVPNDTHVDMLHHLAYTYTFTKWGATDRARRLNALGRLAGWLFRERYRPGQMTVLNATEMLTHSFTFPSDPVRQAHLGFLLAWKETTGRRDRRLDAAMAAERLPVSTSLDPALEREDLEPHVDRWREADRAGDTKRASKEAEQIDRLLRPELERRVALVTQAIESVEDDARPYNAGVSELARESNREHWYQYLRMELRRDDAEDGPAFTPSPETDRYAPAAASRYFVYAASEEFRTSALIHHDEDLQNELIAAGDALRGTIQSVEDESLGTGVTPVWTISAPGDVPLRIREGSDLCVAGLPSRVVQVRSIDRGRDGRLTVEVEVKKLKTVPRGDSQGVLPATDRRLRGQTVTLLPPNRDRISRLKSQRVWERTSPGSWLTHAAPTGPLADLPNEVGEDLVPSGGARDGRSG